MTVSEIDRLHSQLSRLEGMFPGYVTEIVEGSIVMNPVRPFHGRTITRVWLELERLLPSAWALVTDVAFVFDDVNEFCPDLGVIPAEEEAANRSSYPADLLELVVEVVSPGSVMRDLEIKPRKYAESGIPYYLVFDPMAAQCTAFWNPGSGGYAGRDTLPYGKDIVVDTAMGRLVLETGCLPVDEPGRREP